ncbi:MAG: YcaO-like family protein [Desertimonas sp.]
MSTLAPPVIDHTLTWSDPRHGAARLAAFSSPYVGIVHRLFEQLHDVDDINVVGVGAQACHSGPLIGEVCNELNGGGAPLSSVATAAAIGETVERYSAAWVDPDRLRLTTASELRATGLDVLDPAAFALFSDTQYASAGFPFARFTEDTPVLWTQGRRLGGTAAPVLVPAQLVYITGDLGHDDTQVGYATSNGLACASTWEEAVLGGLLEIVERDAFTTAWYSRLSLPLLDPESDADTASWFRKHVVPTGLDVNLVDLSVLVDAPVVLAVIRNPHTDVAPLALGAAAATDPTRAVRKAVVEAFQTRTWAKAEQREGAILSPADGFEQVRDFDDHVRMSLHPATIAACRFLDASSDRRPLRSVPAVADATPAEAIDDLVGRLATQGVEAATVDVTSPDVVEGGLVVAKTIAPRLHPLDAGYLGRYLGGDRLRHRPAQLGLIPEPLTDADLNPWPHPFP